MRTSEIAATYAASLFELASVSGTATRADEQLGDVVRTIRGHVDLRDALGGSAVPAEKKRDILREIFGENVTPAVLAIVQLAVDSGHVDELGEVATVYAALVEDKLGIVPAEVITAVPLTDELRANITGKLSSSLGKRVELRERVDASILGGIIIKVAGRVLDGSLVKQLRDMRSALSTATTGGEA